MRRLIFKVMILVLKMKFKLMKMLRRKKKSADFNIEEEARKLGMTVEDYRRNILLEKPKSRLNDIYDIHQHDIEFVEKWEKKENSTMKLYYQLKERMHLENFMSLRGMLNRYEENQ